jgi:aspartyl protease family protein
MIRFIMMAAVAGASAVGAARAVVALDAANRPAPIAAAVLAPQAPPSDTAIAKSSDGHYWAQGQVDGHAVRFLVDTGATAVALTQDDAKRLGFDPAHLDYSYSVITADGKARAAPIKLASIAVAGARVDDVQAYVIEKGLETSLLGMTYLGRLSRFEATPTSLILRP